MTLHMQRSVPSTQDVFIIDDQPDLAETISLQIPANLTPHLYTNADTLLRELSSFQAPFVLITDLEMGDFSGITLINELLQTTFSVQSILLISGNQEVDERSVAIRTLCFRQKIPVLTLNKPFSKRDLSSALQQLGQLRPVLDEIYRSETSTLYSPVFIPGSPSQTLKRARESLRLTPEEVCAEFQTQRQVQVTTEQYLDWENSPAQLTAQDWYLICQVLKIPSSFYDLGYSKTLHLRRVLHLLMHEKSMLPIKNAVLHDMKLSALESELIQIA